MIFTPIRMVLKTNKNDNHRKHQKITRGCEEVEKSEALYTIGQNIKWCSTYENHYMVPQIIKNKTRKWSSKSTSWYIHKRIESKHFNSYVYTCVHRSIILFFFFAALFSIAARWKQPKCSLTEKYIYKMWYIHTTEHYSS